METEPAILSFAELRERHLALLREWNAAAEAAAAEADLGDDAATALPPAPNGRLPLAPAAETLRAAAAALGGWLDDAEDRDRAQGMIDYWTSALASLPGRQFPELLHLAPFDPALPAAAIVEAETIFAGHQGTAREADAEAMLSCLVRPGAGDTIVCRPPVERVDLEHADGITDQTASQGDLLDALVAAGLIRRQDGETAAQDRFDFTHSSVARAWPRLRALLDKRRNANATRDKLRATANLWKESHGDSGYLLTGPVLDDAGRYFGEDKVLDEFLRASRHNEDRWKKLKLAGWIVGPLLAVVLFFMGSGVGYDFGNTTGFTQGKSSGIEVGTEIGTTIESEAPGAIAYIASEKLDRIRAETQPVRPAGAPGITGWIWIGDDGIRLLRGLDPLRPVDPTTIGSGVAYRTRTRIRLRGGAPNAEYLPGADKGLMPASALVIAMGSPVRFDRPAGPQFWLPVTLVPRLGIRFGDPAHADLARRFRDRMRRIGFDVGEPERIVASEFTSELNFFRKGDLPLAALTSRFVADAFQNPFGNAPGYRCQLVAATNPSYGTGSLDLTLDFTGLTLRDERSARRPADEAPQCQ